MFGFLALVLILCDTIRRMIEGTRPIDWVMFVIELLVLALIAYEVGDGIYRKWRTRRFSSAVLQLMTQGQIIQRDAPTAGTVDEATSAAWVESAKTWMGQAYDSLTAYSAQAAAAFIHDGGGFSVNYGGITGLAQARNWYATLLSRLNNLRRIMENPEAYL